MGTYHRTLSPPPQLAEEVVAGSSTGESATALSAGDVASSNEEWLEALDGRKEPNQRVAGRTEAAIGAWPFWVGQLDAGPLLRASEAVRFCTAHRDKNWSTSAEAFGITGSALVWPPSLAPVVRLAPAVFAMIHPLTEAMLIPIALSKDA